MHVKHNKRISKHVRWTDTEPSTAVFFNTVTDTELGVSKVVDGKVKNLNFSWENQIFR